MARILIIDDETAVRRSLRVLLERAGYEVDEAGDGQAGLRLHAARPADVIITDLFMPDFDGIETILELRRIPRGQDHRHLRRGCDGQTRYADASAIARCPPYVRQAAADPRATGRRPRASRSRRPPAGPRVVT